MYKIFLAAHSGFRFVVFALLVISIGIAVRGWILKSAYSEGNRKLNLFTMISAHIQLLLGIILYFKSPWVQFGNMKDPLIRYWTTEHSLTMIIAIAVITLGHSRSKSVLSGDAKHRTIAIFYGAALILIIEAIILSQRPFLGMTH